MARSAGGGQCAKVKQQTATYPPLAGVARSAGGGPAQKKDIFQKSSRNKRTVISPDNNRENTFATTLRRCSFEIQISTTIPFTANIIVS